MRLTRPLAALISAVAAVTLLATPAAAEHHGNIKESCSGTLLSSAPIKAGTKRLGHVEIWYSSANGGTNCVETHNELGYAAYTEAYLWVSDPGGARTAWDRGTYSSYAGASYIVNADGHCAKAKGVITYNGRGYAALLPGDGGYSWCG
ncbi:hypothetical protein [Promicromonospora soli]